MSSYQITYNGLTINHNTPFIVNYQEGIAGLPIRISQNELTGNDGSAVYKSLYGARTLVFEGIIKAENETEYFENRRQLLSAFSRDGLEHTLTLTLWNGKTYTIDAIVVTTPQIADFHYNVTYNRFRIELICPDPYFRDGTSEEFTATINPGGIGAPVPAPILLPFSDNKAGSTIVINNEGDGDSFPTFRLDGQISGALVTNITTGQSFGIITNITDGRFVLVYRDRGDDYVLLDGTTSYYQFFTGAVFPIIPGNNTIRLTATSAGVNALLTINYQNTFRGL